MAKRVPNKYVFKDDHVELIITNSKGSIFTILIDKDSYELVKDRTWCVKTDDGYVYNSHSSTYLHRLVLDVEKEFDVDHINQNKLDNRKCNLRKCTKAENNRNVKKGITNTSGYKNIYWRENRNCYVVRVKLNGKMHCKHCHTIEEAIEYRNKLLKELHGEFSCFD